MPSCEYYDHVKGARVLPFSTCSLKEVGKKGTPSILYPRIPSKDFVQNQSLIMALILSS